VFADVSGQATPHITFDRQVSARDVTSGLAVEVDRVTDASPTEKYDKDEETT